MLRCMHRLVRQPLQASEIGRKPGRLVRDSRIIGQRRDRNEWPALGESDGSERDGATKRRAHGYYCR